MPEVNIDEIILDKVLSIAHGSFTRDMNFRNVAYTGETFLDMLNRFERGVKDGRCILSGSVVNPPPGARGTNRVAVNMRENYLMMVDFDQGDTPDQVAEKARKHGLFCVIWTTHSHMKAVSTVPEKALLDWLLKTKNTRTTDATEEQLISYFRELIGMREEFLEGATFLSRDNEAGGRVCKLQHKPMPRCRALFILKETFDFATRPGSQQDAINEWKSYYLGFCENVLETTAYDPKCLDPSRLMYLPRIAVDADVSQHAIKIISGKLLDLADVTPIDRNKRVVAPQNNFQKLAKASGATATGEFKTPGLSMFLAKHADDFEAAAFLESYDPDKQCPFADRHTASATGIDSGFKAWNASEKNNSGFGMQCSHSCGADPQRGQGANGKQDRAKYLDALCQKFGILDAEEMVTPEFTPHAEEKEAEELEEAVARRNAAAAQVEVAEEQASDKDSLAARVSALTAQSPPDERTSVLRALAALPRTDLWVGDQVGEFTRVTGMNKRLVTETLSALRREHLTLIRLAQSRPGPGGSGGGIMDGREPPEHPGEARMICHEWNHDAQVVCALERFHKRNAEEPKVFCFNDGPMVRVDDREGKATMKEMTEGMWTPALRQTMRWSKILPNPDGTVGARGVAPFPDVVHDIATGGEVRGLPLLRIGRIPVFGPDGRLRTERGYDRDLQVWLDPEIECLRVSVKPPVEEVEEARWWLEEAICDFPFSDAMGGEETLPVKVGPPDGRGYRETNFERGLASRTNMIAAILLPFVRRMIDGPCPAYHIDKDLAGSGAGYMADCISIINEGAKASAQPMAQHNDEFRKAITATLRDGAGIIFIDNLSRKVDSGDLAAALTAGIWKDRILGKTETISIKMLAMWLFAGNKATFSAELRRRNIPIRIDAAVENATQDRGQDCFKHFPYQPWLLANRAKLVWSCHTIIQHWIACGQQPGAATFHSFDAFASIMSGIMDFAGFPSFLANIPDYIALEELDGSPDKAWAQLCFAKFGLDNSFKFEDMVAATKTLLSTQTLIDIPLDAKGFGKEAHYDARDGHAYIRKNLMKQPWNLVWGKDTPRPPRNERGREGGPLTGDPIRVRLTQIRKENPVKYGFSWVPE